jgi:hypothetical protein
MPTTQAINAIPIISGEMTDPEAFPEYRRALQAARLYLRDNPHFDGRTVVGLARRLPLYTWDCLAAESKACLKAIARRAGTGAG